MSSAVPGSIWTARMSTMIVRRPRKRNRLSAAEANSESASAKITALTTTMMLFWRLIRNDVCVIATMKLSSVGFSGRKWGVDVITSGRGLKAVFTIQ